MALAAAVPLMQLIKLYFVGAFFNGVLPSGFGGDVVQVIEWRRCAANGRWHRHRGSAKRLDGAVYAGAAGDGFESWGVSAGDFVASGRRLSGWFGGRGAAAARLALVSFLERWLDKLPQKVARPFLKLTATLKALPTKSLLLALGISLLFNFLLIGQWTAVSRGINLEISYWYLMGVVPVMAIALLVPSFSGLGVREAIAPLLFAGAGLSEAQAVTLSLMVFFVKRASELVGAPVYLISLWRKRP
ncbi:MAG: lysylphosphatidylglycerol synthase domain-containing protein [Chloroflexota bacterium]